MCSKLAYVVQKPNRRNFSEQFTAGVGMEYQWNINGISMEYLWNIYGISMEYPRPSDAPPTHVPAFCHALWAGEGWY
jgi:hypothetical protein